MNVMIKHWKSKQPQKERQIPNGKKGKFSFDEIT